MCALIPVQRWSAKENVGLLDPLNEAYVIWTPFTFSEKNGIVKTDNEMAMKNYVKISNNIMAME